MKKWEFWKNVPTLNEINHNEIILGPIELVKIVPKLKDFCNIFVIL